MTHIPIQTGLETLKTDYPTEFKGKKLGASGQPGIGGRKLCPRLTDYSRPVPRTIKGPFFTTAWFYAEKQDNMIESDHGMDPD